MRGRELEMRRRPPVPLQEGWEWWVDYPHALAARVRRDRSVVELGRWELAPGLHGSVVRRLRPRAPQWRSRRTVVGLALGLTGVGLLWLAVAILLGLAELVSALWPAAVAGVVGWVIIRVVRHRATCTGLHCPGCRG